MSATRVSDRTGSTEPGPGGGIVIRPLSGADLGDVLRIERASFTVPWTPRTFHGLLGRSDAFLLAADDAGRLVGYAATWVVLDQAELGDIAVDPDRRGEGIGSRLLEAVLAEASSRGVKELYLEVRVSNHGARRLYARYGFLAVGRRPGYYSSPREDALVLRRNLIDSPEANP